MEKPNKFELLQEVYLLHNNIVVKGTVTEIYLDDTTNKSFRTSYDLPKEIQYTIFIDAYKGLASGHFITTISQKRLFSTKEDLLKSL